MLKCNCLHGVIWGHVNLKNPETSTLTCFVVAGYSIRFKGLISYFVLTISQTAKACTSAGDCMSNSDCIFLVALLQLPFL